VASPFGCRSGHIPLSRKPPCPGTGRLARASALLLMHRQRSITIRDGQHTPCSNAMTSSASPYPPFAHLVLNFRDPAPPSPRGVLAYATPKRLPFRLITRNLSSGM